MIENPDTFDPCNNYGVTHFCIRQEYGITREEKLLIGQCICTPLLRKILVDLQRNVDEESTRLDSRYAKGVSTPHRNVRTRLYFTSESHIHSLLTILCYGGLFEANKSNVSAGVRRHSHAWV